MACHVQHFMTLKFCVYIHILLTDMKATLKRAVQTTCLMCRSHSIPVGLFYVHFAAGKHTILILLFPKTTLVYSVPLNHKQFPDENYVFAICQHSQQLLSP